jgi:hypothetical protein
MSIVTFVPDPIVTVTWVAGAVTVITLANP